MPWQITRYSCPGTVKIKLCPVSARFFFPFSFPTLPPSLSLFLSLSLSPSSFSFLLGSAHPGRRWEPGRSCCQRLLLSPSYWDRVNRADGWRRPIKMEGFVPPPLPRAQRQRQSSLLTQAQAPTLPSHHCGTPATLFPLLCTQRIRAVAQAPADPCAAAHCHRIMLLVRDASFPQGRAQCTGGHRMRKHTHGQSTASCWKSNPCCPPSPIPSLCKKQESKELFKAWEINHISV